MPHGTWHMLHLLDVYSMYVVDASSAHMRHCIKRMAAATAVRA